MKILIQINDKQQVECPYHLAFDQNVRIGEFVEDLPVHRLGFNNHSQSLLESFGSVVAVQFCNDANYRDR